MSACLCPQSDVVCTTRDVAHYLSVCEQSRKLSSCSASRVNEGQNDPKVGRKGHRVLVSITSLSLVNAGDGAVGTV